MNFDNFTIKSQEVVQQAVQVAQRSGNQSIEPVHLMKALLDKGESVVNFIFQKLGINKQLVAMQLDRAIGALPRVSGGEPYLSRETNDVLLRALDCSKHLGDEYVTVEALLSAMLKVNSSVATMLKDAGVTEHELEAAIKELRKGATASNQSAEDSYNALSKYAINLNEKARAGKLDPVIGRDDEIRRVLQILSLVGQKSVGYVAFRQLNGSYNSLIKDTHLVVVFIAFFQPTQNCYTARFVRFIYHHHLETALKCFIFLKIFLIFIQCCCTDAS